MIETYNTSAYFETNSYVISNEGKCVIVDPGFDFQDAALEIKSKYEVVAILITHGHCDHIDGIKYFNVPVYVSKLDSDFLFNDNHNLYPAFRKKTPYHEGTLNFVLVNDGDIISLIGKEFRVISTPGHTIGSVCYLYDDKLLSGDTLFKESVGRTDFPTGSSSKLRQSLSKLLADLPANTDVYPGHNSKTTIKHEREFNSFINY